ncbi:MAG TPA: ssl1498 family light-harvesting-like protein [Allocoleopsis sp.]
MYTTVNEEGILNNYAPETPIYYAEYPAVWEQRRYALQGAVATLFVSLLILTSLAVSSIG